jgi:primosomal protein N' (replication factor Y)
VGEGTEKIEEIMREFFPQASIGRMDYDTTRKKGSYHEILAKLAQGQTDLLIGTQMIAKGHDFPRVTLVGAIAADTGLGFPDFRAAERTFQLLTQVAGRAGRGDMAGEVIIQTYYPNHYSLKFACQQNYQDFSGHELGFRQLMHYPPFTHIANLLIKDKSLEKIKRIGEKVAAEIRALRATVPGGDEVKVLGPAPAPLERIKGEYRYQILIKAKDKTILHRILEKSYENLFKARAGMKNVSLDVDPMTIM